MKAVGAKNGIHTAIALATQLDGCEFNIEPALPAGPNFVENLRVPSR